MYEIDDKVLLELGCTKGQLRALLEKTPGGEMGCDERIVATNL